MTKKQEEVIELLKTSNIVGTHTGLYDWSYRIWVRKTDGDTGYDSKTVDIRTVGMLLDKGIAKYKSKEWNGEIIEKA